MRQLRMIRAVALAVALALAAMACPRMAGAAEPLSTDDKAARQSTMAQSIEQHSAGDAFMHIDPSTGAVGRLYPVTQHPMIVRLRDVVVLCADLRTADLRIKDGATVNANFYATRDNDRSVIFRTEIGSRAPLRALVVKGAASLLV